MSGSFKKMSVSSSIAFIVWTVLITGGFVLTGFKPAAQYVTFATWITVGLTAYTGRRLFKHHKDFNNK